MDQNEPFDVQSLLAGIAKMNPVTAIPGLVQQAQPMLDPVQALIARLVGGQGAPAPVQQMQPFDASQPFAGTIKQKMTRR